MFGYRNKAESGAIVINGNHVASTQQCVHCGNHERILQGSGKKRGWCMYCQGFLCGRSFCMHYCIPLEAQLEYQEACHRSDFRTIKRIIDKYPAIKMLLL